MASTSVDSGRSHDVVVSIIPSVVCAVVSGAVSHSGLRTAYAPLPTLISDQQTRRKGSLPQTYVRRLAAAYVGLGVASGMGIEQDAVGRPVDFSRGRSVIVLQHAAEPLSTRYGPFVVRLLRERHNEPVAQALVIAFVMIMVREVGTARRSDASPTRMIRSKHDSLMVRTKRSA